MAEAETTLWVVPAATLPRRARVAARGWTDGLSSFESLRRDLAALSPHPRRLLDGQGVWLAVALAAGGDAVLSAGDVERLQGLAEAVLEARDGRVRARSLVALAEQLGGAPGERLGQVARALTAYEALLRRRGLADVAGQWDDVRAGLASAAAWPRSLQRFAQLRIRLQPPLAPVALEALVALAQLGERCGRAVQFDVPATGAASLDAAVEPLFAAFEAHPELSPTVVQRELPAEGLPLARAVESLGMPSGNSSPVLLFSAGRAASTARVAAFEARAAVEAGLSPTRCAVLVPDAEAAETVATALAAAGLPLGERPARTLASTPAGRVGVLLARLEDRAFPQEDVGWLLLSGLVPAVHPRAPRGTAALLERAGVRDDALGGAGGQGAYRVRLEGLARREGQTERGREARRLVASCERLFEVVRALPSRAPLSEHLLGWQRALEALGFWKGAELAAPLPGPGAEAACRALARDVSAREGWRAVLRGARGGLAALDSRGPELSREGFAAWLAQAASAWMLPSEAGAPGGVDVLLYETGAERDAGFGWLGVLGLAEGRFPRPLQRAGALTDEDRHQVNRALARDAFPLRYGSADVRPPAALALDSWRLGVALSRAESAALGFARDDGFLDVAGPATFLEAFAHSAGVKRVDFPDGPVVPLSRAASEAELREAVALASGGFTEDGAARALAEVLEEPWLDEARALGTMEAERVRAFESPELPSGAFSGAVTAEDLAPFLAEKYAYGPEAALSASTLGKFGRCAFQGFAHTALRLQPAEVPGEALDARAQGTFWHAVLQSLMPKLVAAGLVGQPFRAVPVPLIEAALDEGAQTLEARFSAGHPRLFSLARERARWMVRRLLDAPHHGVPFEGLVPWEVETDFGRPSAPQDWREVRLPAALPEEQDVCLTGSVDRLDAGPAGVAVLDYKASKRRETARELLSTDFQLPFYLQAVRARGERRPLQAGWLVLKSGEFQPFELPTGLAVLLATDGPTRERAAAEGLPNVSNAVHALVQNSRRGEFGARPVDCGFCPFGPVCRIGSRRKESGW